MNTLPERVSQKIAETIAAIQFVSDDLKLAGAEANLIGDFEQVLKLNETCRKLLAFESDIKACVNNFRNRGSSMRNSHNENSKASRHAKRRPLCRIRVHLHDKVIEESTIAETFVKTLRSFGLDRVARLNKVITSVPLLSRSPN